MATNSQVAYIARFLHFWQSIAFEIRREGEDPSFPFGVDAKGFLIYTDVGRFSVQIMRANRPKFASGDQLTGSVEGGNYGLTGCVSCFGRYGCDENGGFVLHHIESSLYPDWGGAEKHFLEFSGSQMSLITPLSFGMGK